MRKTLMAALWMLACTAWTAHAQNSVETQKNLEKRIIGEWCNPYTWQDTGELKGFRFEPGGKCSAVGIPSLELDTWRIEDGYLLIKGHSVDENGKREAYETRERIGQLTSDSLELVTQEASPRLAFLYLNTRSIKKLAPREEPDASKQR